MNIRRLLPLLLLPALLSGCGESPSATPVATDTEMKAIDFSFPNLDGEPRSLNQWQGKVVMLNFWAPWCPPCIKETPAFVELQEEYADKGFIIVGITIDTKENAQTFADTMGINYPILIAEDKGIALAKNYGNKIGTLPFTVILDRQGRVVATHRSEFTREDAEKVLVNLL
jgi:peroxiredoxin